MACILKETQVEVLKPKIQKAMGARMEKAADAVMESMMTMWQSMIGQARAKEDLQEKLSGLLRESK
jgi:hypothetical protein